MWDYGALASKLPPGDYCLIGEAPVSAVDACIAFALGSWRFTRYRDDSKGRPRLVWPAKCDRARFETCAGSLKKRHHSLHSDLTDGKAAAGEQQRQQAPGEPVVEVVDQPGLAAGRQGGLGEAGPDQHLAGR